MNSAGVSGTLDFQTANVSRVFLNATGSVGIGTTSPMSTLDVNGFAKLKLNGSAPATCDAPHQGSLALTSSAGLCVCNTANNWVIVNDGGACAW